MEEKAILEQILKRLDVLISLELEKPLSDKSTSMATRILRLQALGLSPAEIAAIIGKPTNYVSATLSKQKKAQRKKRGGASD